MPKPKNNHPPISSPTQTYLKKRSRRMAKPAQTMLVRLRRAPETVLQLPSEVAHSLVVRRLARPVGDLQAVPDLVLTEDDLEASGLDLPTLAAA
jgi:hypothetical protein